MVEVATILVGAGVGAYLQPHNAVAAAVLAAILTAVVLTVLVAVWKLLSAPYRLLEAARQSNQVLGEQLARLTSPLLEVFDVGAKDATHKEMLPSGRSVLSSRYIKAKYIKVGMRALALRARECRAYITHISRRRPDGTVEDAVREDPIALKWSLTNGDEAVELHRGLQRYFDVVACDDGKNMLELCGGVVWPLSLRGFFDKEGIYVIRTLVTSADAPPVEQDVFINWNGKAMEVLAGRELADVTRAD